MAGEAMLAGWVCGGEGRGGLVELFGGVVGGGDLVVGVVLFGSKITTAKEKRLTEDRSPSNHTYSLYTTGLG